MKEIENLLAGLADSVSIYGIKLMVSALEWEIDSFCEKVIK